MEQASSCSGTIQCGGILDGFSHVAGNGMYGYQIVWQSWLAEGVRLWMSQFFARQTYLFHRMSKKYPPMFSASSPQVLKIRSFGLGPVICLRDSIPFLCE